MDSVDFQRVEVDLQRQLHSDRLGNIQSNRLMLQDFPLSPTGNYSIPNVNNWKDCVYGGGGGGVGRVLYVLCLFL